jgi:hypothetical protein
MGSVGEPVRIDAADLSTLLWCSIRYAIGRGSYAPGEIADIVERHSACLQPWQRDRIAGEIEGELRASPDMPSSDVWRGLARWLTGAKRRWERTG